MAVGKPTPNLLSVGDRSCDLNIILDIRQGKNPNQSFVLEDSIFPNYHIYVFCDRLCNYKY